MDDALEMPFPRPPSGRPVANPPSGMVPARSPLVGRHIRLEPLDPNKHAVELYRAGHGSDEALRIWDFLPWGPWPDEAAFLAWLRGQAGNFERVCSTTPISTRPARRGVRCRR